jgi:hypothetical protein
MWDFVNSRGLPAKPQLNSRSIDFTLTYLTYLKIIKSIICVKLDYWLI